MEDGLGQVGWGAESPVAESIWFKFRFTMHWLSDFGQVASFSLCLSHLSSLWTSKQTLPCEL
jgi:hypothetical protein